ncbi:hypothetical protein EW146_g7233 [Bondarzewia mesenterica]|uniref:Cytochrome c oxidase subunit IV n=1 Tax=Bondarzewia mesenterica TaxID=1095465 RepID=A0A4S4LS09_9AGAM|nr:hypothetical protein EW146_g7233 [Bondarzewia mesenterica]
MHPALRIAARPARRCFTTAAHPIASSSSSAQASVIPLSNVEAQWEKMSAEDQISVHQQLEVLQKKDWKELSLDQKKAGVFAGTELTSFLTISSSTCTRVMSILRPLTVVLRRVWPTRTRAPINPPGTSTKVTAGVFGLIAASAVIYASFRAIAPAPPRTINKEWEEATNERAREAKINPISGAYSLFLANASPRVSSEGYTGKGYVSHK